MRERQVRGRSRAGDYAAVAVRVRGGAWGFNHLECDQDCAILWWERQVVGRVGWGLMQI